MKLNELTIAAARKQLDAKEISAHSLTEACLKAIKQHNKKFNICLTIDEIGARIAAKEADKRLLAGERGALLGIPFVAKDNIMTKGLRTTAASKMLENYIAPYDATVIKKLKAAGAILLAKTNLDEFAHGASTEYSAFGVTKNPFDSTRVAGGSSGGSAAAVAANFCLFALGTDTGGSVRHPAAFCGVVGLKPSYGLCSRFGLISMTSSTDVPGVLAKDVRDAALVLQTIAGHDTLDATSLPTKKTKYTLSSKIDWKNVRIGVPDFKVSGPVKKEFDRTIGEIKKAGAKIVKVSLPSSEYAIAAYYIITPSEVSSNLARFDGLRFGSTKGKKKISESYEAVRESGFGPEVKRRIMLGTYCLSAGYYDAYYIRAQKVRTKIISEFTNAFSRCDLIMTPTTPTPAFKIGSKNKKPLEMYLEDLFLAPSSLAGLPAISVPAAKSPLPIGIQIIAPLQAEARLLSISQAIESFGIDRFVQPNV